jgi:tetratricopeptide (TPR) repeat protein
MLRRNLVLFTCSFIIVTARVASAAANNYYPEIRSIILEAENASTGITGLPDGSKLLSWAADLLARAGYLDDAGRVGAKAAVPPEQFASAQTLYGGLEGALKAVATMRDPERRTTRLTGLGNILWRMGDPANARKLLDEAERAANTLPNLAHRKVQLQLIAQQKGALSDDPPVPLSAKPHPEPRKTADSRIPAFPVTVDGFRDKNPDEIAKRTKENEVYLTQLYALVAARDREGLLKHTAEASSPFQKTLGLASIEHLLIHVGAVKDAEQSARAIPNDGADCTLAKAEALTAAGTAWARIGDSERAQETFESALQNVASVGRDLAFGKAIVIASIAAAEAESGMIATGNKTFETALKSVSQVEPCPKPVKGVYPKTYFGRRFQDDAYRLIFGVAIRAHDLGAARHTVDLWRAAGGSGENVSIVDAWLGVGRKDEALSYARGLKDAIERVPTLLWMARSLLDEAGAPLL